MVSIQSEITRISGNVADALDAIENKGVTIPAGSNSDDLADLIGQITGAPTLQAKTNISPTTSSQTITADNGYDGLSSVQINAMPSGSASTPATTITANPSISVSSSGLITASNSKTQSVTPTVSAGYVSSGTAGTITVSGSKTQQLTTQAAQTLYPSTTDQTISSGKYLTGTQTFKGVLLTNLDAGNIKKDVVVKVGDSADDDRIISVTGTYEGGGGGGVSTASFGGISYTTTYYTNANMQYTTVDDDIVSASAPVGSLIVCRGVSGPAAIPMFGLTLRASWGSRTAMVTVYEVTG